MCIDKRALSLGLTNWVMCVGGTVWEGGDRSSLQEVFLELSTSVCPLKQTSPSCPVFFVSGVKFALIPLFVPLQHLKSCLNQVFYLFSSKERMYHPALNRDSLLFLHATSWCSKRQKGPFRSVATPLNCLSPWSSRQSRCLTQMLPLNISVLSFQPGF